MAMPRDNAPEEPTDETRKLAVARERRAPMTYRITFDEGFLRAELAHRETVEEMREFLRAVARNSARCPAVLIRVRESKPLFHVERGGLVECLVQIARAPQHRVALVADTADLQASHEYLELIARQRGVRVRSFRSEPEALLWFKDQRAEPERRVGGERRRGDGPRQAVERRTVAERRQGERRGKRRGQSTF
jgi:hypothetical protein